MTEQQKDFVQMYLKHNCKITAHNIVYGENPNYDSVESSANRLLRIPEIAETIRSIKDGIRHEVEEEFKAKYREELLTIYDKRLLLKKIATGEMYIEQKYKGKNCTQCSQYISPTYPIMMQALREDSRLAGHYPHKIAGKWVIPALQTQPEQEAELSPAGGGGSLPADGGGTFAKDTPEKDNKRQHVSLSPAGGGGSLSADGGGIREEQETTPEKDNIGQQLNEIIIDNQPLTVEQENTTETPLLFLGGDIGVRPEGVPNAFGSQSGCPDSYRDPDGQETDENPEKDPSDQVIRAGNNRQHLDETNTDNQPLTKSLETSVNPSANIISQEKLRELLYPLSAAVATAKGA